MAESAPRGIRRNFGLVDDQAGHCRSGPVPAVVDTSIVSSTCRSVSLPTISVSSLRQRTAT